MNNCNQCSKTSDEFSDKQGFRRHIKSHEGEFSCETCGKLLKNSRVLRKHIKSVHSIKTFACDNCNKKFKEKSKLKEHIIIHNYGKTSTLRRKQSSHHKLKKCDYCHKISKDFSDLQGFYRHLKSHGEGKKCEQCGTKLKNDRVLKEHMKAVHESRSFPCEKCNKSFQTKSNLQRHKSVHYTKQTHTENIPPKEVLICPEWPSCDIDFKNEQHLNDHIRSKHGEGVSYCYHCDKTFQSNKLLSNHKIEYHATVGERTCKICQKVFKYISGMNNCLKKHKITSDVEFVTLNNEKLIERIDINTSMKYEDGGIKNMEQEKDSISITSKTDPIDHLAQKHLNELERTCKYCFKIFNCINSMDTCMKKHEEIDLILSRNYEYNKNISIMCEDGVKVKTNIFMLCSVSPWLYTIIQEHIHQEEITIIFPDIQSENVRKLLREIEIIINGSTLETLMKQKSDAISPFFQVLCLGTKSADDKLNNNGECNKPNIYKVSIKSEPIESTHEKCDAQNIHESSKDCPNSISESKSEKNDDIGVVTGQKRKRGMKKLGRPKKFSVISKKGIHPKVENINPGQNIVALVPREDHKRSITMLGVNQKKVSLALRKDHQDSLFLAALCPFCGSKFENRNLEEKRNFEDHVLKHASDQVPCECQETWKTNAEKAKHLKVKHLGYSQCNKCSQYFRKKKSLVRHIQCMHNENKKEFLCYVCAKCFKTNSNFNQHIKTMHENEVVTCDYCQESFVGRNKMLNHRRTAHQIMGKECPICGKIIRELSKHLRFVHAEEKDKNHLCNGCDKAFLSRTKLEDHRMNVHIKTRPYKCRYGCSFAYNDRANRNTHEKKKHGELFTKNAAADGN